MRKGLFTLFVLFVSVSLFVNQPITASDDAAPAPATFSEEDMIAAAPDNALDARQDEGLKEAAKAVKEAKANAAAAMKAAKNANGTDSVARQRGGNRQIEDKLISMYLLPSGQPVCQTQAEDFLSSLKAYTRNMCSEQWEKFWKTEVPAAAKKAGWIERADEISALKAEIASLKAQVAGIDDRLKVVEKKLETVMTDAVEAAKKAGDLAGATAAEKLLQEFKDAAKQYSDAVEGYIAAKKAAIVEYKDAVDRMEKAAVTYASATDRLATVVDARSYIDSIKTELQGEIANAKSDLEKRDVQIAKALATCGGWTNGKVRKAGNELLSDLDD